MTTPAPRRSNSRPPSARGYRRPVDLAIVSREDRTLPREFSGAITFPDVVATLDLLVGETTCVSVRSDPRAKPFLEAIGELGRSKAQTHFSIGAHLVLALDEALCREARLVTLEGNFYFKIALMVGGTYLTIGDEEIVGSGLTDPAAP